MPDNLNLTALRQGMAAGQNIFETARQVREDRMDKERLRASLAYNGALQAQAESRKRLNQLEAEKSKLELQTLIDTNPIRKQILELERNRLEASIRKEQNLAAAAEAGRLRDIHDQKIDARKQHYSELGMLEGARVGREQLADFAASKGLNDAAKALRSTPASLNEVLEGQIREDLKSPDYRRFAAASMLADKIGLDSLQRSQIEANRVGLAFEQLGQSASSTLLFPELLRLQAAEEGRDPESLDSTVNRIMDKLTPETEGLVERLKEGFKDPKSLQAARRKVALMNPELARQADSPDPKERRRARERLEAKARALASQKQEFE